MARINANNRVCHSERSEESRGGKEKRFIAYALSDKLIVNCQWLIVMRGIRRIMKLIVNCQWSMVMRGTRRIMYLENNN